MKKYNISYAFIGFTFPIILLIGTYGFYDLIRGIIDGSYIVREFAMIGVIYFWYRMLTSPFEITIHDDKRIEFVRLYKSITLKPEQILYVKEDPINSGLYVYYTHGKIKISSLFYKLTELKSAVKSIADKNVV